MKSMNFKAVALSLCMVLGVNMVYGQSDKGAVSTSKHEVRLSASDGLTMGSVSILGMGISDALTGTKRVDDKYSLVYGLGYRYSLNRFRVGADLGFSQSKSKLVLFGEKTPAVKERELNFLVLPTAEFVYYRKGILELYGGAGAGGGAVDVHVGVFDAPVVGVDDVAVHAHFLLGERGRHGQEEEQQEKEMSWFHADDARADD